MQLHLDDGRRSGRTWRALAALPDGSIYLVPSERVASHCRGLLHQMGRPRSAIRFATPDNYQRYLGARSPATDADHSVWELRPRRAREAFDFLQLTVTPYF